MRNSCDIHKFKEIFCIVEGGFRGVRQAIKGCDIMSTAHSSWSARLFATYHETIPSIEVRRFL